MRNVGNSITLVKLSKLINIFFSNITLSYTIGRVFINKILRQKMLGSFCQLIKKTGFKPLSHNDRGLLAPVLLLGTAG